MNLELNEKEIGYILNLLAERPYKESANIISHIMSQVSKPSEE